MRTFEVGVISTGGADAHKIRVQATSESNAKEKALQIANANAKTNGKPYEYKVTSVVSSIG